MSKRISLKPIAAALGTTFAVSLAAMPIANADENPFHATALTKGGYMVAGNEAEGKCGEGSNDEAKPDDGTMQDEGKSEDEGKCGDEKSDDAKSEGEGKCGN